MKNTDDISSQVMCGFPPRPETRITSSNWFNLPYLRWSLMNRSTLVPTVAVWRGDGPVSELPCTPQELDSLSVPGLDNSPANLSSLLASLEIDGFLVMHKGKVVYERYMHGMKSSTLHGTASVSKAFLGALVGILEVHKVIDLSKAVDHYVPEITGTAMGGATLRQLLDMEAGIVRPEIDGRPGELGAQDGGVYEVLGLMPRKPDSPKDFYDFILKKPHAGPHGQAFYYDNGQPEAVGWAIRRATGRSISDLMSELLFAPMGFQRDGLFSVDNTGAEFTAGGLGVTLRDMARFGETLRCEGWWNGRQIIPASFIADVRKGGNREFFAASKYGAIMKTGSYRSFFWMTHDDMEGFMGLGRFGQRIYVSPRADLVISQFSSAAGPGPHPFDKPTLELQRTLAMHFLGMKG
jgi:CubicO group peptidase (beta-lactamase class C family)